MIEHSNSDLVAGCETWQSMLVARLTLQQQEMQRLKDENEALRLTISPSPIVPVAPVPVRVVTQIEMDGERE